MSSKLIAQFTAVVLAAHLSLRELKKLRQQSSASSDSASNVVAGLGLVPHPEGGFFLETFRSGCAPMSTMGQSGYSCDSKDLVTTSRSSRPDGKAERNCMTSIYWMPTLASPRLWLAVNSSDHVHYYHGGAPFEYILVEDGLLRRVVLGPDFSKGQRMQVAVKGGTWKAGRLCTLKSGGADYCLIGEAVAPGFDFHDFSWISADKVKAAGEIVTSKELASGTHIALLSGISNPSTLLPACLLQVLKSQRNYCRTSRSSLRVSPRTLRASTSSTRRETCRRRGRGTVYKIISYVLILFIEVYCATCCCS